MVEAREIGSGRSIQRTTSLHVSLTWEEDEERVSVFSVSYGVLRCVTVCYGSDVTQVSGIDTVKMSVSQCECTSRVRTECE